MALKQRRATFTFDERSLLTQEQMEARFSLRPPYCRSCHSVRMLHCHDFIHCSQVVWTDETPLDTEP